MPHSCCSSLRSFVTTYLSPFIAVRIVVSPSELINWWWHLEEPFFVQNTLVFATCHLYHRHHQSIMSQLDGFGYIIVSLHSAWFNAFFSINLHSLHHCLSSLTKFSSVFLFFFWCLFGHQHFSQLLFVMSPIYMAFWCILFNKIAKKTILSGIFSFILNLVLSIDYFLSRLFFFFHWST